MEPEVFWSKWGWDENPPYFGKIASLPEKSYLLAGRKNLLQAAARDLKRQITIGDQGIALVCGSPGVGKSTFLECLLNQQFPKVSKRVTLIRFVEDPNSGFSKIRPEHFLRIFSEVESFLLTILGGRKIDDDQTQLSQNMGSILSQINNVVDGYNRDYVEFTRDILHPLCEQIHQRRGELEQHYLAIDDVDYLSPSDQKLFLSVICSMASITGNPKILYSSRPVAARIARHCITDLMSHQTSESIRLPSLDASRVIDFRCRDGGRVPDAINPLRDEGVREIVNSYCSGNLREALRYAIIAQQYPHKILRISKPQYEAESFIRLLFGDFRRDDSYDDGDIDRDLLDVFEMLALNDRLPFLYVCLVTVDGLGECFVNDEFYRTFRKNAKRMNKAFNNNQITNDRIFDLVSICHRNHLFRRVAVSDIAKFVNADFEDHRNRLLNTKVRLTTRGERLLVLSRDPVYQGISRFSSWRTGVRDFVVNHSLNLNSSENGEYIIRNLSD